MLSSEPARERSGSVELDKRERAGGLALTIRIVALRWPGADRGGDSFVAVRSRAITALWTKRNRPPDGSRLPARAWNSHDHTVPPCREPVSQDERSTIGCSVSRPNPTAVQTVAAGQEILVKSVGGPGIVSAVQAVPSQVAAPAPRA